MYNHDRLDDPVIRDNAIIEITTHGEFVLDTTNNRTFPVPEDMNVIIISSTTPGTCNYITDNIFLRNHTKIMETLEYMNTQLNLLTTNMSEDTINDVKSSFSIIAKGLQNVDKRIYESFRKGRYYIISSFEKEYNDTHNTDNTDNTDTSFEKEYMDTFDRSYRVNFYKSGEQIFNKIYSRKDREINELNSKINMLTKYGNEDLMIELTRHHPDGSTPLYNSNITLEELINFLKSENIKNVVIFDFTCSVLKRNDKLIRDERVIRRERREMLNQETETDLQNKTRKKRLTVDTRGGKRFTRKNRKSRKSRKHFRKSRKRFRTMNKQK